MVENICVWVIGWLNFIKIYNGFIGEQKKTLCCFDFFL